MFVFAAGYTGTTKNLQFVLNTQKSPYLNQATEKNTCQISRNWKFQTPQKSFDHPRHLKSGVPLSWDNVWQRVAGFHSKFEISYFKKKI